MLRKGWSQQLPAQPELQQFCWRGSPEGCQRDPCMAMRSVVEACVRLTPAAGMHTCMTKMSALGQAEKATAESCKSEKCSKSGQGLPCRRVTQHKHELRTSLSLGKVACMHPLPWHRMPRHDHAACFAQHPCLGSDADGCGVAMASQKTLTQPCAWLHTAILWGHHLQCSMRCIEHKDDMHVQGKGVLGR